MHDVQLHGEIELTDPCMSLLLHLLGYKLARDSTFELPTCVSFPTEYSMKNNMRNPTSYDDDDVSLVIE